MRSDALAERTCWTVHTRGMDWETCARTNQPQGLRVPACDAPVITRTIAGFDFKQHAVDGMEKATLVASYSTCAGCPQHEVNYAGLTFLKFLGFKMRMRETVHGRVAFGIAAPATSSDGHHHYDPAGYRPLLTVMLDQWSSWLAHQLALPVELRGLAQLGPAEPYAY